MGNSKPQEEKKTWDAFPYSATVHADKDDKTNCFSLEKQYFMRFFLISLT